MGAPTPKFWSGRCQGCGQTYVRRSCKAPKYCNDQCQRRTWLKNYRKHGPRTYAERKVQYKDRMAMIEAQVKSGELNDTPGNVCAKCEKKVSMDSEPLTGRTVQTCGCGTRFIGRWA